MKKGLALLVVLSFVGSSATAWAGAANRPDGWIKLCGLSTGCTIDPLPHRWRGNDIYNATGARQSWAVLMEDGEGVRFWITLQNDGTTDDTLVVQGCQGTRRFVVNRVVLGKFKEPDSSAMKITDEFLDGTAAFALAPGARSVFTLNMLAPTTAEGVSYSCEMTISSQADPSKTDTLVATMTTY